MTSDTFFWACHDSTGGTMTSGVDGTPLPTTQFPTQPEAEAWLAESWSELVEAGADSVSLVRDGETVYGPMSLRGPA